MILSMAAILPNCCNFGSYRKATRARANSGHCATRYAMHPTGAAA